MILIPTHIEDSINSPSSIQSSSAELVLPLLSGFELLSVLPTSVFGQWLRRGRSPEQHNEANLPLHHVKLPYITLRHEADLYVGPSGQIHVRSLPLLDSQILSLSLLAWLSMLV